MLCTRGIMTLIAAVDGRVVVVTTQEEEKHAASSRLGSFACVRLTLSVAPSQPSFHLGSLFCCVCVSRSLSVSSCLLLHHKGVGQGSRFSFPTVGN